MREIKFRAYIKPLKRYAKNYETILYYHQCNMEPTWTVNLISGEYYDEESLIIEQDTGLKDKNGKEIYEGDILMNSTGEPIQHWVVKFCDGGFVGEYKGVIENLFELTHLEIIGNVHKDLELLEEK